MHVKASSAELLTHTGLLSPPPSPRPSSSVTLSPHIDLVLVGAADDVLVGHGQGVDTAPSLALQHMHTLQCLQLPNLHTQRINLSCDSASSQGLQSCDIASYPGLQSCDQALAVPRGCSHVT